MNQAQRGATRVAIDVQELHGDWPEGVHRLSPVRSGIVHAMHTGTFEVVECAFDVTRLPWVGSGDGPFARVGTAVSRDGDGDGEYVIAAPIDDDRRVPAISIPGELDDVAGTPAGTELLMPSIIEVGNSATNADGYPFRHFCHGTVCSSDHPHPDGARPMGAGPPWCYTGEGAAMNWRGCYQADEHGWRIYPFDHALWWSGYEVGAAKCPLEKVFPLPSHFFDRSPIRWRPYSESAPQI